MEMDKYYDDAYVNMETFTIVLPKLFGTLYRRVAELEGNTVEQVLSDVLLLSAGELSLGALHKDGIEPEDIIRMDEEDPM